MRHARGRVVVDGRGLGPPQRADHAGEQDGEPVAAGVDDAGLAEDRQQLGPALDRVLAGVEGALDDVGDERVLLVRRWRRG